MIETVLKRNGATERFDGLKLFNSIGQAIRNAGMKLSSSAALALNFSIRQELRDCAGSTITSARLREVCCRALSDNRLFAAERAYSSFKKPVQTL